MLISATRPKLALGARGSALGLLLVAPFFLALSACGALAQAADRGGFWGRPAQQPRDEMQDREAARLYADARADLDTGQQATAQRRLEILVARYPLSPLADVARRDLQRLYSAGLGGASQPPQPAGSSRTATSGSGPAAPLPIAPVAIQATPSVASVSTPPLPPIGVREASEDFRVVAGDRVFFADSGTDLGGRARAALEAQAQWLTRYPGIEIVIEGHSDDHGSREFNRDIAEKRAQSVKVLLADLGVTANRITVVSYGRDRPVADCAQAECTVQNRRVVTVITRVPSGLGFEPSRTAGGGRGAANVPQR